MDWLDFGKQFGSAALALAATWYGLYKLGYLYIMEVARPESKRRIEYWDAKEKTDVQVVQTLLTVTQTLNQITETQKQHLEVCRRESHEWQVSHEHRPVPGIVG